MSNSNEPHGTDPWMHLLIEGEEEVNFAKYNLSEKSYQPATVDNEEPAGIGDVLRIDSSAENQDPRRTT